MEMGRTSGNNCILQRQFEALLVWTSPMIGFPRSVSMNRRSLHLSHATKLSFECKGPYVTSSARFALPLTTMILDNGVGYSPASVVNLSYS